MLQAMGYPNGGLSTTDSMSSPAAISPVLTIRELSNTRDGISVSLSLFADGHETTCEAYDLAFRLDDDSREDFRWYVEDYLQFSDDPAPQHAARVENRIAKVGEDLFWALFKANPSAEKIWDLVASILESVWIEIVLCRNSVTPIPWELLRTQDSGLIIALGARAFVRRETAESSEPGVDFAARNGKAGVREGDGSDFCGEALRILFIISRPKGQHDVPFRSIANQLLRIIQEGKGQPIELSLLRPPSHARLREVLVEARQAGRPFHVVHFDGHGIYEDLEAQMLGFRPRAERMRGYLLFEGATGPVFVDGERLGMDLVAGQVRALVLNACQSAYSVPRGRPREGQSVDLERSFESLAQEVARASGCTVVAMQYKIYVPTAAKFIAGLYVALIEGRLSLEEAVSRGRKDLADRPIREAGIRRERIQDWIVPIVYGSVRESSVFLDTSGEAKGLPAQRRLDRPVWSTDRLEAPTFGFIGRDVVLQILDAAFQSSPVLLLKGYAGSGKTATAVEFVSWLGYTGGLPEGPTLFSVFKRGYTLEKVIDELIERAFQGEIMERGVSWLALDSEGRRALSLELLGQKGATWIWDNLEVLDDSPESVRAFGGFLKEASELGCRFLLTSRRSVAWAPGATVVRMPALALDECILLARAICEKRQWGFGNVMTWVPILLYSDGNPMALSAGVLQAIHAGVETKEDMQSLVDAIRSGEVDLAVSDEGGMSRSLTASLRHGIASHFSSEEQSRLSYISLFQGFLNADALVCMGGLGAFPWGLETWQGMSRDEVVDLLGQAADLGLLSQVGPGLFRIHPAVPPITRRYLDEGVTDPGHWKSIQRAFCEAYNLLGALAHREFNSGRSDMAELMGNEEENLLRARTLSLENQWFFACTGAMQGLQVFYGFMGLSGRWAEEVMTIVPYFMQADGTPYPGRVGDWRLVLHYRAELAITEGDVNEAERLQTLLIDHFESKPDIDSHDSIPEDSGFTLTGVGKVGSNYHAQAYSAALNERGQIRLRQGDPECVPDFLKALALCDSVGYEFGAAMCLMNLGGAHTHIPVVQDLELARRYLQRSLSKLDPQDHFSRGKVLGSMGVTYLFELRELKGVQRVEAGELASRFMWNAKILLSQVPAERLVIELNLGFLHAEFGRHQEAIGFFLETIRLAEECGLAHEADLARLHTAESYLELGQLRQASDYAKSVGRSGAASEDVERLLERIATVERERSEAR